MGGCPSTREAPGRTAWAAVGICLLLLLPHGATAGLLGDPLTREQYGLDLIHAHEAWRMADGDLRVAVVDSGVDPTHGDLLAQVDLANSTSVAEPTGTYGTLPAGPWDVILDTEGHGTLVTGVLAAQRGNGLGIAGVADAQVLMIKAWGLGALGTSQALATGVHAALDRDVRVLQVSATTTSLTPSLADALARAEALGVVVVAAAGNDGSDAARFPAARGTVVGVGAVDADKALWTSSNRASADLVAPGVDIWSTHPGNLYLQATGTSLAAPHVAGVAALVLDACPGLAPGQVRDVLNTTAEPLGQQGAEPGTGWGLVRADRAVQAGLERCPGQA